MFPSYLKGSNQSIHLAFKKLDEFLLTFSAPEIRFDLKFEDLLFQYNMIQKLLYMELETRGENTGPIRVTLNQAYKAMLKPPDEQTNAIVKNGKAQLLKLRNEYLSRLDIAA